MLCTYFYRVSGMINDITEKLYAGIPEERLYHSTNFNGLMGIVESRSLGYIRLGKK
ncbi:hypothetical protein [Desulfocastanea catecholica]